MLCSVLVSRKFYTKTDNETASVSLLKKLKIKEFDLVLLKGTAKSLFQ